MQSVQEWQQLQVENEDEFPDPAVQIRELQDTQEQKFLNMRLNCVSGICSGLAFLHENR